MIAISNCILGSGVLRSFFFVFYIFFTMSFSDLAVAYGEYCSVLNDAVTQAEDDIWATYCVLKLGFSTRIFYTAYVCVLETATSNSEL